MIENTKNKVNKGFLYPNINKTKPTHPDYTGKISIELNGSIVEKRLAAWLNSDSNGQKYLSIISSDPIHQENKGNNNSIEIQTQATQKASVSSTISDDLEDLEAILKIDDNPFNG
jgi:hypothetical protein